MNNCTKETPNFQQPNRYSYPNHDPESSFPVEGISYLNTHTSQILDQQSFTTKAIR